MEMDRDDASMTNKYFVDNTQYCTNQIHTRTHRHGRYLGNLFSHRLHESDGLFGGDHRLGDLGVRQAVQAARIAVFVGGRR